ncbi:ATP-binding protein [Accumulibacter sp.]|uniref:ATP-binding protein n=1 Tax=Accumulibacter sp. TaxID=2053492 RepID=UPI0025FE0385|nr:ATP-binding protein [Accumulibacter sp.]MCP5227322.1 HAMP domain-containing protein [Accumulibacter sp.]
MIRLTIQRKVFLATFALATAMALLLTLIMRWNLGDGFARYTSAAELARLDGMVRNIEGEYARHGNWDFMRAEPEQTWPRLSRPYLEGSPDRQRPEHPAGFPPGFPPGLQPPPFRQGQGPGSAGRPEPPPSPAGASSPPDTGDPGTQRQRDLPNARPPFDVLRVGPRLALVDADGKWLAGNAEASGVGAATAITYQGHVVGQLTLRAAPSAERELDAAFLASQTDNMLVAGLAALGFSLLAAWLLARHLLAPIGDLARAARQIAGGTLDARIQIRSEDELGQLAADFNDMAERLGRVEESRRAWISESSHELRTPLAVLRAEIEAMQDGVRTPNAATLARLHKQVQQLTKLVDDLRLTLDREPAEGAMEREMVAPVAVLEETIETFRERYDAAGIRLDSAQLVDAGWQVCGDAGRLMQVFGNLLENSLRYTRAGGQLRITARASKQQLLLEFDDSAPAPPAAALPRLFERFFRAEPSRSRAFGGSGLGLAICRTLVEAHGGQISATASALGGLKIRIELPLEKP